MLRWPPNDSPAEAGRSALDLLLDLQETRLAFVDRLEALTSSDAVPRLHDVRRAVAMFLKLQRLNAAAARLRRQAGADPSGRHGGEAGSTRFRG